MKLTIGVATRNRPELLRQTLEDMLPNVSRDDTRILILADEDDKVTLDGIKRLPTDSRLTVSVRPREESRGEKYDRVITEAPADLYLPAVDHSPILTPAFDQILINTARLFPDGIGCVYTPMVNASFPGLQAPTAKLVDKLGGIYNREYPYWFIDHELDDICRMIGRFAFADVRYSDRRRPGTTIRMYDVAFWARYYEIMRDERVARALAIIDDPEFECPDWYRQVLKTQHPVVTARSAFINGGVIQDAAHIERERGDKNPQDEGYKRAKARALQKVSDLSERKAA